MSLPPDYHPTPTPLPPAPRKACASHRFIELWILRIASIPFILFGILLPFYAFFVLLAMIFSTSVPAIVTGVEESHSIYRGHIIHSLSYHYVVAGNDFEGKDNVELDVFNHFRDLTTLSTAERAATIRYFQLGPFHHAELIQNSTSWSEFLRGIICFLIFDLFIAYIFKAWWLDPIRVRHLYQYGDAVTGSITQKITKTSKGDDWHYLEFVYEPSGSKMKQHGKTLVWSKKRWQNSKEGEAVTILYNPRRPKNAVIYEYGDYEIK